VLAKDVFLYVLGFLAIFLETLKWCEV